MDEGRGGEGGMVLGWVFGQGMSEMNREKGWDEG